MTLHSCLDFGEVGEVGAGADGTEDEADAVGAGIDLIFGEWSALSTTQSTETERAPINVEVGATACG